MALTPIKDSSRRGYCRKPQPIKTQVCGAQSRGYMSNPTPVPKAQGSLRTRGWKDCKSRRISEFVMRLCFLGMSDAVPIDASPTWPPKCEPNKGGLPKWMGKARKASTLHKERAAMECWEQEKQKNTPAGYPSAHVGSTFTSDIRQIELNIKVALMYLGMCMVCIYVCVCVMHT